MLKKTNVEPAQIVMLRMSFHPELSSFEVFIGG